MPSCPDFAGLVQRTGSHTAARILDAAYGAFDSLVRSYVRFQDEFAGDGTPTELRTVITLRVHDAVLRCEFTVLKVTVHADDMCSAELALKIVETELDYNVTPDDRERLLGGLNFLYIGVKEIFSDERKDELCFSLPPRDFH